MRVQAVGQLIGVCILVCLFGVILISRFDNLDEGIQVNESYKSDENEAQYKNILQQIQVFSRNMEGTHLPESRLGDASKFDRSFESTQSIVQSILNAPNGNQVEVEPSKTREWLQAGRYLHHLTPIKQPLKREHVLLGTPGALNVHVWEAWCGSRIEDLRRNKYFPFYPDIYTNVSRFYVRWTETGYGQRIFGFVHPPESGEYRFAVSCDDNCEVWLSLSEEPSEIEKIIWVGNSSAPSNTPVGSFRLYPTQISKGIHLEQGRKYYIEALHKQAAFKDHILVAWLAPSWDRVKVIGEKFISSYLPVSYNSKDVAEYAEYVASSEASLPYDVSSANLLDIYEFNKGEHKFGASDARDYFHNLPLVDAADFDDLLPKHQYRPSYVVNFKLGRYEGVKMIHESAVFPNDFTELTHMMEYNDCLEYRRSGSLNESSVGNRSIVGIRVPGRPEVLAVSPFPTQKVTLAGLHAGAGHSRTGHGFLDGDRGNGPADENATREEAVKFSDLIDKPPTLTEMAEGVPALNLGHDRTLQKNSGGFETGTTSSHAVEIGLSGRGGLLFASDKINQREPSGELNSEEYARLMPTPQTTLRSHPRVKSDLNFTESSNKSSEVLSNGDLANIGQPRGQPGPEYMEIGRKWYSNAVTTATPPDGHALGRTHESGRQLGYFFRTAQLLRRYYNFSDGERKNVLKTSADLLEGFNVFGRSLFHLLRDSRRDSDYKYSHVLSTCKADGNVLLSPKVANDVVKLLMAEIKRKHGSKYALKNVLNVEENHDVVYGDRYLVELELSVEGEASSRRLSRYVYKPIGRFDLHEPSGFQWNPHATVHVVVPVKDQGRWVLHFISNMESIYMETQDPNLNVIIVDFGSRDINIKRALSSSKLKRHQLVELSGPFERARGIHAGVNLVQNPADIIFTCDLHLEIPSQLIASIRKHVIKAKMAFAPIVHRLSCGYTPELPYGLWEIQGYGMFAISVEDYYRAGGMNTKDFQTKWGGEDWDFLDRVLQAGLEVERLRVPKFYHYHHSRKRMWIEASSSSVRAPSSRFFQSLRRGNDSVGRS